MIQRLSLLLLAVLILIAGEAPAAGQFPSNGDGADTSDPYDYGRYMYVAPSQYPPNDIAPGDKERWEYSSKNACDLYGRFDLRCSDAVNVNPQELYGITGASVDKAWERTSGRPDVVIAVHDSGIKWNDRGAMNDLANKTWLNPGELPEPDWGTRDSLRPYDRNNDGVFNIRDYCPDWGDVRDCGGTGDSRVRGDASAADTDYNANGFIDPEDLIFGFSDGLDDDSNGYTDDFVGWDTYEDDNDPYDEVQYGHGTGEAEDSTAEIFNGRGVGTCPNCMVMHMRVGDSFIADVNDFAEGVLYATDNGASVLQSALGTLNNSRFAQEAINYAYKRGVVLIASAADESAGHHNQPSVLEHAVTMNSIGEPQVPGAQPPSYLEFRGCTNFGAYITAAVPSNSCSSEATGRSAGMAGLLYAAAKNAGASGLIADYGALDGPGGVPAGRGLSAEEADQLIATSADDLNFVTPLLYTARPSYPETERYPATEGWDPFFGYGRINAERMVRAVALGKIPPEADITSPKWFEILDPGAGDIEIKGRVASLRSSKYSYNVKWALWSWREANTAPIYLTEGVSLAQPGDHSSPISGTLATIDADTVKLLMTAANGAVGATSGPAVDPVTGRGDHENRQIPDKFGVIARLEVVAKDSNGNNLTDIDGQPLTGVGIKNFNFHSDPALFPGYPKDLQGDGAASPRFADLDSDGADDLIVATSNGEVHAFTHTGGELPGWPVTTTDAQLNYGARAYRSGEITTPVHAASLRSATVGDIDRDGDLEVFVPDFQGRISGFDHLGNALPGFPVRSDPAFSAPQRPDREAGFYALHPELVEGRYGGPGTMPASADLVPDLVNRKTKANRTIWWFLAAPALANIDPADDALEIIAGAADRHLYAFKADGSRVPGWPLMLRDPAMLGSTDPYTHEIANRAGVATYNGAKVVVSPSVGDIDGDGSLEILATVNEQYKEPPNSDDPLPHALSPIANVGNNRLYAIYQDGSLHGTGPGTPSNGHPNANAFLPGWPAKVVTATIELLPVVGNGPNGAAVLGNVDGGTDLEIGIFGTVGPAYIFDHSGRSIYGQDVFGRDRTLLLNGTGAGSNSPDTPSIPGLGGAIYTRLVPGGPLSLALPAAGLGKFVDVILPEDQLLSDNHLAVYELGGSRLQLPSFPREVNDLQFLATPASADVDGDGLEEVLAGTAYSDLHAFNGAGLEPGLNTLAETGWPKFTAGWSVTPPSVGDFDGDGYRDIAHVIREGTLFLWEGNGADTCDPATWPEFGHDGWNTNNVETDAVRPGAITGMTATRIDHKVKVTWKSPGDDGRCGKAFSYEVRTSRAPITAQNFEDADPVSQTPRPSAGGSTENFFIDPPPCDLYLGVRAWDADPAADTAVHPANVSAPGSVLIRGTDPTCSLSSASSLETATGPLASAMVAGMAVTPADPDPTTMLWAIALALLLTLALTKAKTT